MHEVQEFFEAGGVVVWVLTGLGVMLWGLILERLLSGRRKGTHRGGDDMNHVVGLRRMGLIRAGIVIAPLLGLLGTVTGMIDTFEAMLMTGQAMDMGRGIREALWTTQYGLVIAAPAMVAECVLVIRSDRVTE